MNTYSSCHAASSERPELCQELFRIPSVEIDGIPTQHVCELAGRLWDDILPFVETKWCLETKLRHWEVLFHTCCVAAATAGTVRFRQNRQHTKATLLQVIHAAEKAGLVYVITSKPGGVHSSRLIPTNKLKRWIPIGVDPWDFVPPTTSTFVKMRLPIDKSNRLRGEERDLEFDSDDPIAAEYQKRLELVNEINSSSRIMYTPTSDLWQRSELWLRPIHTAIFHPNWQHGRLYTLGHFGHTNLPASERHTITFNGEPSSEFDFSAMHPRMLYHLCSQDFEGDPYGLWGPDTTKVQRNVAKFVLNSCINARNALLACHAKVSLREHKQGRCRVKSGRDLEKAKKLSVELAEIGTTFRGVQNMIFNTHRPIASYFGTSAGAELMRLDSAIAIDILHHFARKGIPVLGVHDSFIVPNSYGDELREVMIQCYRTKLGFDPVVKPAR